MTRAGRVAAAVAAVALVAAPGAGPSAHASTHLAAGTRSDRGSTFVAKRIEGDLASPTAFTFGPGDMLVYGERFTGRIRIIHRDTGSDHVLFRIPDLDSILDRGLLGVAVHPDYPDKPFVYAFVTRHTPSGSRNQIVRVTNDGGHGTDLQVLFSIPVGPWHQGGRIMFGPDGMLYAFIGDGLDEKAAQDRESGRGKILRMTPWGAPAPGNPFPHSRVWSFGHRNAFGFAFDPDTGRLWETENGPHCNDELNRVVVGGNYAWGPHEEEDCVPAMPGARETNRDGPAPRRQPEAWWTPTIAPTGIAFCDGCGLGPASEGKAFVGDYNTHAVRRLDLSADRLHVVSQRVLYRARAAITSVETGPDGGIYFSLPEAIYRLVRS